MSRWIIGCAVAAALLFVLLYPSRTVKTAYVNGLAPYTSLPGRVYIFERDCYIFKLKKADSDWPLVGSRLTVPSLPEVVDPKYVGADLPDVRILDTVTTGTRFRIASVRRDEKDGHSTITYEIVFLDESSRKFPRLDSTWMLDHTAEGPGTAPTIRTDYAVPQRSG